MSSICVLKSDKVLVGNKFGDIIYCNLLFNQIISIQCMGGGSVTCIVESEDNKIVSSFMDFTGIIIIYG